MSFFKRILSLGQAEANSVLDKLEDPVKMTEQGIRELQDDLIKSKEAFAQVKAISITAQKDMERAKMEARDWEVKAMSLLQHGQQGRMAMPEAERLASEALKRKDECLKRFGQAMSIFEGQQQTISRVQTNIDRLQATIGGYQNELVTLKARATSARATQKIDRQLAGVDSSSTLAMIERMKEKVRDEESLAQAYQDMADRPKSVEEEINQALLSGSSGTLPHQAELNAMKQKLALSEPAPNNDALVALKAKMGIE